MKIFQYGCGACSAVRLFTEEQHAVIESLVGSDLRERRALVQHERRRTFDDGGPPLLVKCEGHLWHRATLEAEVRS